ncbi:MAG: hypothetical protein ACQESP_08815 [Candidatus Muiribacteriota bacterium]
MALLSFSKKNKNIKILSSTFLKKIKGENYTFYYWGIIFKNPEKKISNIHSFINKIDGEYAGIIKYKQNIYITRCFPGTVPLYYTKIDNTFLVADRFSEFNTLIPQREEFIKKIINYEKINPRKTLYKNIKRFIPGGYANIDDGHFHQLIFCFKIKTQKSYKKRLKKAVSKRINNSALFLSEGLDSGLLYKLSRSLNKKIAALSIIFDEESLNLIENRIKNKNFYPHDFKKIENALKNKNFNSIDYFFSTSTYIFTPLLEKAENMNIKKIILGFGGDEIHGVDFFEALYFDYMLYFNLLNIIKYRRFFKDFLKKPTLKTFKKSFLKKRIYELLYDSFHIYSLEMIWMFFTEKNIYPVYPYFDKEVLSLVFSLSPFKILKIHPRRDKARKLSYNIYKKKAIKKGFDKVDNFFEFIEINDKNRYNYNEKLNEKTYNLWRASFEKRKL